MLQQMIELRRIAHRARCRIKRWKLTEAQAYKLADEVQNTHFSRTIREIVSEMKRGDAKLYGIPIVVR